MTVEQVHERQKKGHNSDETKRRLIEAGLELFGHYSFDGVTTRNITDRANVNLASIQYYFGGKEGLYLAVAQSIVQRVQSWMEDEISRIEGILRNENPDKHTGFRLLCELLDKILCHALGESQANKWMGILLREQLEPTAAFDIFYDGFLDPVQHCFRQLIGRLLELPEDDQEIKLRSYVLVGSVLMFHVSRAEVGRTLNWKAYNSEQIETIRRVVLDHVRGTFGMPTELLQAYFDSSPKAS